MGQQAGWGGENGAVAEPVGVVRPNISKQKHCGMDCLLGALPWIRHLNSSFVIPAKAGIQQYASALLLIVLDSGSGPE